MYVAIRTEPFEPYTELRRYERAALAGGAVGATAIFVGTMRDFNDGATVAGMTLEYYPGMTERHLERIAAEAQARWSLDDCLIVHRVGQLAPGDPIVVVAAWSARRSAAFEACRFLIEDLKQRAPFWKKEARPEGGRVIERWVEHNTPA